MEILITESNISEALIIKALKATQCRQEKQIDWKHFTSYKAFSKNKKRSGISIPVRLSAYFLKKNISLVIFYYFRNFNISLSLLREILSNMRVAIACLQGCDVINFEINLIFLFKAFFLHNQTDNTKG